MYRQLPVAPLNTTRQGGELHGQSAPVCNAEYNTGRQDTASKPSITAPKGYRWPAVRFLRAK